VLREDHGDDEKLLLGQGGRERGLLCQNEGNDVPELLPGQGKKPG
jgi:hypothetical protein